MSGLVCHDASPVMSVSTVLQAWTLMRLKCYMRDHKMDGRSHLKRKHEMIEHITCNMSTEQRDLLLCATGRDFYWLKYTPFPTEVVSLIVNFIRRENMWWNTLSMKDLENLLRVCVLFTPPSLTKHGMKTMLKSIFADFDEAQNLNRQIRIAIRGHKANSMNVWQLRHLRKKYIYENVAKYGPKYLLCVPTPVLLTDIRLTLNQQGLAPSSAGVFNGWHDKVMRAYMQINFPNVSFDMSELV